MAGLFWPKANIYGLKYILLWIVGIVALVHCQFPSSVWTKVDCGSALFNRIAPCYTHGQFSLGSNPRDPHINAVLAWTLLAGCAAAFLRGFLIEQDGK